MKANFYLSPLDQPLYFNEIEKPTKLLSLLRNPGDDKEHIAWLKDNVSIALDGEIIPPNRWGQLTIKPRPTGEINIVVMPGSKKVFAVLAAVAAVALTAGIAAFGIPFLGAGFAAGTLGANLVAAGVGIAGSLLIGALTAPPKVSNSSEERQAIGAGVSGNSAVPLDTLPMVIGAIGLSPPYLAPPYTSWDGDNLTAHAIVGVQGRCTIEDVKINGLPIDDFAGVIYETREGYPGDAARTLFLQTVIEERDGITLSNFQTELDLNANDLLIDQVNPENSSPKFHSFRTAGNFKEATLRFLFPSGIVYTPNGTAAVVPVRIEVRKVGDASWRKLPTLHFSDVRLGSGPMRAEVRIERIRQPTGRHFCSARDEYPIFDAVVLTGQGQSFEYQADPYFITPNLTTSGTSIPELPPFTSNSQAGYTISSSSIFGVGTEAYRAFDNGIGTPYWGPLNNTLGEAWIQIQLPTAQTFKSYDMCCAPTSGVAVPTNAPTSWMVSGSNDGTTWTDLDDVPIDISANPGWLGHYQIGNPGSYLYYRWTFLKNAGAASEALRVGAIIPMTRDAIGAVLNDYDEGQGIYVGKGAFQRNNGDTTTGSRCSYVSIDKRGARIFLDPDNWAEGEYEIRVKRGVALYQPFYQSIETTAGGGDGYKYASDLPSADYFDYRSSGGFKIYIGQRLYRSDCTIECFQTIDDEVPFDPKGIALIALSLPNGQVSSIYGKFTKYASEYSGGIWNAEKTPTTNPAAHYRDLLLGDGNSDPVPGEVVDEDGLTSWFQTCAANGYEANAVLQGARVNDAKQLIATAGYASPRDSRVYGVIEDKDTTSDPIRYLITPLNSKDTGNLSEVRRLPHAIQAEFSNEERSYSVDHILVYREGYNASNATLFETINYAGFTNELKVQARAEFDLKQMYLRQARYSREVGLEFLGIQRGDLVGLGDDTIDGDRVAGWIKSVQTSGGNVVSITLDNIVPWSISGGIENVEDIESLTDVLDTSEPMGVAIRIPGQDLMYKQVIEVTDSNTCTFATPFVDDGSIVRDLLVVAGKFERPIRRCRVLQVIPRGFETRTVILTDEAPDLYL